MTDLTWESSYAIALALIDTYPDLNVEDIGYEQLIEIVTALPDFIDDPELANEGLLDYIIRDWYEEMTEA